MIKGVDVSHWNGDVDFEKLKVAGYDFAIIKATQGTWLVDDKLLRNVACCQDAGMAYSLYHFLDPIMDGYQDGNEQYEFFMEKTEGLHGDLPNALDAEWQGPLSKADYTALVLDFLVQQNNWLDHYWLLYSNLNFLNNIILQPDDVARYAEIWLAWPSDYAISPIMPKYYKPVLWQYNWDTIDKNKVLDEVWYHSCVKPTPPIYKVQVIAPKGVEVEVITEG